MDLGCPLLRGSFVRRLRRRAATPFISMTFKIFARFLPVSSRWSPYDQARCSRNIAKLFEKIASLCRLPVNSRQISEGRFQICGIVVCYFLIVLATNPYVERPNLQDIQFGDLSKVTHKFVHFEWAHRHLYCFVHWKWPFCASVVVPEVENQTQFFRPWNQNLSALVVFPSNVV